MKELLVKYKEALELVRHQLSCDFSAVARLDRRDNRIKWECISGGISNRLCQMSVKPGSGIAGHVIRHGRPFILDASVPELEKERNRNPAMLAERLYSVMAVPIFEDDHIDGVLLVGKREKVHFAEDDLNQLTELARQF